MLKKNVITLFFVLNLFFAHEVYATMYQPGETLEPDCAPTSSLCGVLTMSLNGQTSTTQAFVVGMDGTNFTIVSSSDVHTFHIPSASTSTRGLLSSLDWTAFSNKLSSSLDDGKIFIGSSTNTAAAYLISGDATLSNAGILTLTDLHTTSGTLYLGTSATSVSFGAAGAIVTGAGAFTLNSGAATALTLDSGTTGALNIGTGSSTKSITIGNTTGATTLRFQSGTGTVMFQVGGTETTGNVQVGAGGSGSATPDLFVLDTKSTSGDPTGANGALYYNANTGKFRCFENSAWVNCITPLGGDLQHAASYDTDEAVTNIPTGGAQVVLGTISLTPANSTGDIYVTGWAEAYSSNGTDQPLQIMIETTADCTGSTVGNASVTYTITSGASAVNVRGVIRVSGIAVDTGTSAQPYSLCAAVTSGAGDSDIMNWGIEAFVVDTGADLAEIYTTFDERIQPGDLVSIDPRLKTGVQKTVDAHDRAVIGIVSTRPGRLIGSVDKEGTRAVPVALSGRVPVNVVTENGAIEPGDYLAPSSVPGVAMKASGSGLVIGQAMSSYDHEGVGTVLAFVKNFDRSAAAERICLKKLDGTEVCMDGDRLQSILDRPASEQESL